MAVIGPVPPPIHGHMVFTERILTSRLLNREFRIIHVDVSDHRDLENLGRLDLLNVWHAAVHALRLLRVLVRYRPSVVYVPLAQNMLGLGRDLVFVVLALVSGARVLPHVHGGGLGAFLAGAPAWFRAPALHLLRRSAALVVMSNWQREDIAPLFPSTPLMVVPHGTESCATPKRSARTDPLHVLYASSTLQETKGLSTLLEAASIAQREGTTSRWDIVGPWVRDSDRRRGEVIAQNVPGIQFHGEVSRRELLHFYESADVFVFPPQAAEGFGLVRIEAMAAGLPVITTEAGGAHEILRDGVDGFIVPYENPNEIVRRLGELRLEPERRLAMGAQAQRRQRERFGEDAFEEALAHVWRFAAAGQTQHRCVGHGR